MGEDEKYKKITKCMKEAVLVASGKRIKPKDEGDNNQMKRKSPNDSRKKIRSRQFRNPVKWQSVQRKYAIQ